MALASITRTPSVLISLVYPPASASNLARSSDRGSVDGGRGRSRGVGIACLGVAVCGHRSGGATALAKHECALSHQSSNRKADRTLASLELERGQSTIEHSFL